MDPDVKKWVDDLASRDDPVRMQALQLVLKLTDSPVDWVYEVWDDLVARLDHENSFQRSIAIMVLCNLAKSDAEGRLDACLDRLLAHTHDEKFITSRQCLQNVWKLALVGKPARDRVVAHLEQRFRECAGEKHYNLLREDAVRSMRLLYEAQQDDTLLAMAGALLAEEKEEKYRKKYAALLRPR